MLEPIEARIMIAVGLTLLGLAALFLLHPRVLANTVVVVLTWVDSRFCTEPIDCIASASEIQLLLDAQSLKPRGFKPLVPKEARVVQWGTYSGRPLLRYNVARCRNIK